MLVFGRLLVPPLPCLMNIMCVTLVIGIWFHEHALQQTALEDKAPESQCRKGLSYTELHQITHDSTVHRCRSPGRRLAVVQGCRRGLPPGNLLPPTNHCGLAM